MTDWGGGGVLSLHFVANMHLLYIYLVLLSFKMHLGSSSSSSPHSMIFLNPSSKFLQTFSPSAQSDAGRQALLAGLLTKDFVSVVNMWSSLDLINMIWIILGQKHRREIPGQDTPLPVQAEANHLISLCLRSLPVKWKRILFSCLCYFSSYWYLF